VRIAAATISAELWGTMAGTLRRSARVSQITRFGRNTQAMLTTKVVDP